ncbi:hypothetical protein OAE08_05600 [Gammaproteobacteria bacterium]|jgi:hypothetical protein|nr:hypothetical protein [Gammaproteobacteria bacterium]|tara:strand:+ start:155 stop:529 length:375 start_codon:yes stop_codon:yes gene_type:complete
MKKFALGIAMLIVSNGLLAGPVVEVYECTLNEGQTIVDANNMMEQFSSYIEDAGLNYTAHLGFQQLPIKTNSINWIGIAPTATDFGKALEWLTGTAEGAAFGVLYNSVYTCENSFATYITASSN